MSKPYNKTWKDTLEENVVDYNGNRKQVRYIVGQLQEEAYARGIAYQVELEEEDSTPVVSATTRVWCDRAPYVVEWGVTEISELISQTRRNPDLHMVVFYRDDNHQPVYLSVDKISAVEAAD
jgi:hypothetical protein